MASAIVLTGMPRSTASGLRNSPKVWRTPMAALMITDAATTTRKSLLRTMPRSCASAGAATKEKDSLSVERASRVLRRLRHQPALEIAQLGPALRFFGADQPIGGLSGDRPLD